MTALLLFHVAVAAAALAAGPRLGSRVFYVAAAAPAATLAWALAQTGGVIDGTATTQSWAWVPELGLTIDFRLDGLGLVMALLIGGVGVAVFAYSAAYFHGKARTGYLAAVLTLFAGAMVGLVLTDNLLALYGFWELTSVTSYLLIAFDDKNGSARAAALHAILVTSAGGLAMLAGFVILGQAAGTFSLSAIVAEPPTGTAVTVALLLVLVGAFTKSAQAPFHAWLPGAMAAPTPISAYLHSATMVKAGVYLIARFAPVLAVVGPWQPLVIGVGLTTMVLGGYRALRQTDLKLVLAYGTVAQLGLLTAVFGLGTGEAAIAGAALLLAHGAFKATLFLVVGIVDHQTGTRDLRRITGLHRTLRPVFVLAAIGTASMIGLPPLFGFVAKEEALGAFLDHSWGGALGGAVLVGSILTVAYSLRFLWGAFGDKSMRELGNDPVGPDAVGPTWTWIAPIAALTAFTVIAGLVPDLLSALVLAAGRAADPALDGFHLALWHGVNTALLLSLASFAGGAIVFHYRRTVRRLPAVTPSLDTAHLYRRGLSLLNVVADQVTGLAQNGSLPVYLGVILLTAVALPAVWLVQAPVPWSELESGPALLIVVAVGIAALAIALVRATRRITAVILLGGVGYLVAVLFVIQGAPDLALTQLLVETLGVTMFVLVLRHLPERFEALPLRSGRLLRAAVAAAVGVFMTLFTLVATGARVAEPVSTEQVARALSDGGGRNVVNVILVDIRGLDTLGEITVIAVAALGVLTLVRARREPEEPAAEVEGPLVHGPDAGAPTTESPGVNP